MAKNKVASMTICKFHPDRGEGLWLAYPLPPDLALANESWMLCRECLLHYMDHDWEYFKGLSR